MIFAVYVPPATGGGGGAVPCLKWLSGLTCTDLNFVEKAGGARQAARRGIALVCPDTSPRGLGISGEDESYDIGTGAGFYLNARQEPWSNGYKMESYVKEELVDLLGTIHEIDLSRGLAISGHSMGGHGALTLALKYPDQYRSVSALAPICHPTQCPWGIKAFSTYFGPEEWLEFGKEYDATEILQAMTTDQVKDCAYDTILIDQGANDTFLIGDVNQLRPEDFRAVCEAKSQPLELRYQSGYDHSYYFISSFIDDHIDHAAERLLS